MYKKRSRDEKTTVKEIKYKIFYSGIHTQVEIPLPMFTFVVEQQLYLRLPYIPLIYT